jgi:MFS family permease
MSTLGIGVLVIAFAFVPFVNSVWQLALMAGLFSVGMAFGNTGLTALVSEAAENRLQGTVLSVTSSLDSFSGIVAPPASTALLGAFGSPWSAASSLVFGLIAFVMGVQNGKRDAVSTAPSVESAAS